MYLLLQFRTAVDMKIVDISLDWLSNNLYHDQTVLMHRLLWIYMVLKWHSLTIYRRYSSPVISSYKVLKRGMNYQNKIYKTLKIFAQSDKGPPYCRSC